MDVSLTKEEIGVIIAALRDQVNQAMEISIFDSDATHRARARYLTEAGELIEMLEGFLM